MQTESLIARHIFRDSITPFGSLDADPHSAHESPKVLPISRNDVLEPSRCTQVLFHHRLLIADELD